MVALLMLGLIPGTNIQINFDQWLQAMAVLLGIIVVYAMLKTRVGTQRQTEDTHPVSRRIKKQVLQQA